jgi:hypothetical protein
MLNDPEQADVYRLEELGIVGDQQRAALNREMVHSDPFNGYPSFHEQLVRIVFQQSVLFQTAVFTPVLSNL